MIPCLRHKPGTVFDSRVQGILHHILHLCAFHRRGNHGSKLCLINESKTNALRSLAGHALRAVQAAGIMSEEDRKKLKLRAYNPWPLAHSAHLGKVRPAGLGEEPDWGEAADSLRDEFGAKYTPEEVRSHVTSKLNF